MERYDAGNINSFGGGDVEWWQNYIRSELERAHDFYAQQAENIRQQAIRECAEVADDSRRTVSLCVSVKECSAYNDACWDIAAAIRALAERG